jgi:hypothetical protein
MNKEECTGISTSEVSAALAITTCAISLKLCQGVLYTQWDHGSGPVVEGYEQKSTQ